MAYDEKTKAYVRRYYVFDCLTLEQAADKAGVPFGTARRWKKQAQERGDNWDIVRDAHTGAQGKVDEVAAGLLTRFVLYFGTVLEQLEAEPDMSPSQKAELLSGLGDSFTKMTAAAKRISPKVSELETALKTVQLFGNYTKAHKPQLFAEFLDLLDGFGETLTREFK